MGKRNYLIYGLFVILLSTIGLFFGPEKAVAADIDVVINEVMANPQGSDANHEWVEIFNSGSVDINLQNWQLKIFNDPASSSPTKTIKFTSLNLVAGGFLVLVNTAATYKPCDSCLTYDGGPYTLTNSKGKISLTNAAETWINDFSWSNDVGDGVSMEIIGPPGDSDYQTWNRSLVSGGTPGAKNSVAGVTLPQPPILVSPISGEKFAGQNKIDFSWQEATPNVTFEFILSKNTDLSDSIIDESNLVEQKYTGEDLDNSIYYWQVIASNGVYQTASEISSFEILTTVYSDEIVINELYPDPALASESEWIELYNNSDKSVDLKDWILEDLKGSVHQYKIPQSLLIPAWGYVAIFRTESGITLNNDQDGIRLTQPNGNILYETPIFADGAKGWSFARTPSGTWQWTTTTTPTTVNVITAPVIETDDSAEDTETDIPINSSPIDIKTGEYRNYENYLVTITGTVVETSGNTFYLDDGSGKAKVYIQSATEIDKPEMHAGDIFEVTGIVNLYRDTWRILPQKQDDIKLIEAVQKDVEVKTSSAKKLTATTASTKKTTTSSNATARSPTKSKQVASAGDQNSQVKVEAAKSPFWVQLIKAITGLAVILLILIIIKMWQYRRENVPLGGNFGDET